MTQALYGIIGYPLQQSFSQSYFRKKFSSLSIQADYLNFEITDIIHFPQILIEHPTLKGINVTSPYKQQILAFVHNKSDAVLKIGAANCLSLHHNIITAHNTDVLGFMQSLTPLLHTHHTKALILGTGGAASAAAYVLAQLNIDYLFVSRNNNTTANHILYSNINQNILQQYTIIINASPSGMIPFQDTFPPLPYQYLTPNHLIYDMVYKPEETILMQKAKAQGAIIKNGFEMLQLQAEAGWEIWNQL